MTFTETTNAAGVRRLVFTAEGAFDALRDAEAWCEANGVSYAPGCARSLHVHGLMYGNFQISKFRNLSKSERAQLDGTMHAPRGGPATITIKPRKSTQP